MTSICAQQSITGTITHDGEERTYLLTVPASFDATTPTPLVLNLHGYRSNLNEQAFYGSFAVPSQNYGFLVVHPQGLLDANGEPHWNANWGSGVDDVGFLSNLIDSLSAEYNIDRQRVYSTGMSNGGFMSYTLACELSDKIAAIASVTGTMTVGQENICDSNKAVPIMQIHGTADFVVPYAGNGLSTPIDEVIDFWVNKNGCEATPQFTMVDDIVTNDGSTAEHYVYSNGTDGASVELYKIIGGGHTWPGAIINIGVTNQDINASEKIWEFFSKYTLDGLVTDVAQPNDDFSLNIYPNPAEDVLNLAFDTMGNNDIFTLKIYDILGNVVVTHENTSQRSFDISSLEMGTYLVQINANNRQSTRKIVVRR